MGVRTAYRLPVVTLPTAGVYYLRVDLSTGTKDATIAGDYYFCTIWNGTPTPP